MAIDQQQKRRNLALEMMKNASDLVDALDAIQLNVAEYTNSQCQFVDGDFQLAGLVHVDANAAAVFMNSINAMKTAMDSNGWTAAIEKVIP